MTNSLDDYELDLRFGAWLRDQRVAVNLTIEQASKESGISSQRMRSLELGYSEKGITRSESEKLSALYKTKLSEFLHYACSANIRY
jgi:transcriptional regulator with XRE-family HTH domain